MTYELVREIQNLCPNNQKRDVFFEEVETDDPASYVRRLEVTLSSETLDDGSVSVYAAAVGLTQKLCFTPV